MIKVGLQLHDQLCFEDILVSKEVYDFLSVDWHSLLISIVHGRLVKEPSVLKSKVLILGQLGKSFFEIVGAGIVSQGLRSTDLVVKIAASVFNHMHENLGLLFVEGGQKWHQILEFILVRLVLLELSWLLQVSELDNILKSVRLGEISVEEVLIDVFLVVELSDLILIVNDCIFEIIVQSAVEAGEGVPFFLSMLWLWFLRSLGKFEWHRQHFLHVRIGELLTRVHLL